MFYILNVREKLTHEIQNRKNSSKNIIWNWISYTTHPPLPKQTKLKLMTTIMMFFKDLERYGIYKDSQFILNIPQELLRELIDRWKEIEKKDSSPKEENKISFGELSAVEWLYNKWGNCKVWKWEEIEQWFEQAKEMEYKQNMSHMQKGMELQEKENNRIGFRERNGITSSQTEISDEEILNIAKECVLEDLITSIESFVLGAKMYRETIKIKTTS